MQVADAGHRRAGVRDGQAVPDAPLLELRGAAELPALAARDVLDLTHEPALGKGCRGQAKDVRDQHQPDGRDAPSHGRTVAVPLRVVLRLVQKDWPAARAGQNGQALALATSARSSADGSNPSRSSMACARRATRSVGPGRPLRSSSEAMAT